MDAPLGPSGAESAVPEAVLRARMQNRLWLTTVILIATFVVTLLTREPPSNTSSYHAPSAKRTGGLDLSGLLANPYDPGDFPRTPAEEMRLRFAKPMPSPRERRARPDISGTTLVLRAISAFNPDERSTMVGDAVRHLRHYPQVKDEVWALVEQYRRNNPWMSEHVLAVKEAVEQRLEIASGEGHNLLEY